MFDRNAPTPEEKALKNKLLAFSSAVNIPLVFTVDGVKTKGLAESAKPIIKRIVCNSEVETTEISAVAAKGLLVNVRCTAYNAFPVAEWGAEITNRSYKNSGILSEFALSGFIPGSSPEISVGNGDTGDANAYLRRCGIPLEKKNVISPFNALSTSGASPFVILSFKEYSVLFAVGWSGKWRLELEKKGTGVKFTLSQEKINISVLPLETIRTPNLTLMLWRGTTPRGINIWRRFYFKHILPLDINGNSFPPQTLLKTHSGGENISAENQIQAVETYIRRGMRPDIWAVDAGWYACGGSWKNTGDWHADPDRLPDGFYPIGEKCRAYNIKLLVWFEPERAAAGSKLDYQHPEWLISPDENEEDENRLVDLTNKDCFEFLLEVFDNIIKTGKIAVYRHDFNLIPDAFFIGDEKPDRIGAAENLYVQALLNFLDELRRRNPGLLIDASAFGGKRNDLDILRRSVSLNYASVHEGDINEKLRRYNEMFSFTPYFSASAFEKDARFPKTYVIDEYTYIAAVAPCINIMTEFFGSDSLFKLWEKFESIWKKAAKYQLTADYYQLNDYLDGWYAAQFDSPLDGGGFIQVIRTKGAQKNRISIKPYMRENAKYVFSNPLTGETKKGDGAGLAEGFVFFMPERRGEIWFYASEEKGS